MHHYQFKYHNATASTVLQHFQELNYEAIKEAPATDVWDLLSDIGGTLGLYVGVSFLTFGEVVELLIECATSPTKKLLRQRAAQKLNF